MARSRPLPEKFTSRYGIPVIGRVHPAIFTQRYYTHCLACGFCGDACCQYGVDVDLIHVGAIEAHASELESWTGIPRDRWFEPGVETDPEVPGGGLRRTRVEGDRCVFHNRTGRGCLIHSYCLDRGLDYHDLKSMVDCLFPVTYYDDVLCPAPEIEDGTLICMNSGPTLYRGVREEIRYYFGDRCVDALDEMEASVGTSSF